jgi:predicted Rossmann fold flavoprotein
MKKVVVIGAGAAGLFAAGIAAFNGKKVILIEKNDRPGKKILITGKGRCNITNSIPEIRELIDNVPNNGRFLYSAFSRFSNLDIINFFNENGLATKIERGGRVFPESNRAVDVVETLKRFCTKNGVEFIYNSTVKGIDQEAGKVLSVILKDNKKIMCDSVILCTGGKSYPGTGSTGDGYKIAEKLGHCITELKPSLVPFQMNEKYCKQLEGLSLKNISIKIKNSKDKVIIEDFGEMVFTSFGVSGPVILSASSHILKENINTLKLYIDLKPALSDEKLDERILRDFEKYTRKCFKNSLDDLLPQKMIPVFIELSGIDPMKHINQITKDERKKITNLIKNFPLTINSFRPIEEAIVTSGGISINEINPATMESKLINGLFFAGEIIDVDAYTGGFNLTIAFSTGYLAGLNA